MAKRMDGDDRKRIIVDAGAKLAGKWGAKNVTRAMVAKEAKVSPGLVAYYMGDATEAQKAYAARARKLKIAQPDKRAVEELGRKLRAHGPRKNKVKRSVASKNPKPRVRSEREKAAIKRKVGTKLPKRKVVARSPEVAENSIPVPQPVNVPPPKPARKRAVRAPLPKPVAPPPIPSPSDTNQE